MSDFSVVKPDMPSPEKAPTNGESQGWLSSTVAGAGLTSALGDFCYETTMVILPGFLAVLGVWYGRCRCAGDQLSRARYRRRSRKIRIERDRRCVMDSRLTSF